MRSDMMKMAKSHQKLQTKLKDLDQLEKTKKLLQAMAFYVSYLEPIVIPIVYTEVLVWMLYYFK